MDWEHHHWHPGQKFTVDFDTGSSDLWVFSTLLPPESAQNHTLFNPALSPSFQELPDTTFSLQYGDGSQVSGTAGLETVTLGGATAPRQAMTPPASRPASAQAQAQAHSSFASVQASSSCC